MPGEYPHPRHEPRVRQDRHRGCGGGPSPQEHQGQQGQGAPGWNSGIWTGKVMDGELREHNLRINSHDIHT